MSKCSERGYFIFQNPRDLNYFYKNIDLQKVYKYKLIYGSGLPKKYFKELIKKDFWIKNTKEELISTNKIDLIFCGRLLKSKGISLF